MSDNSTPLLLVIAGPAGSGKSTLCDRLVAANIGFSRIITTTTRKPRPGEINGVHYHFLNRADFEAKVAKGEFLEWAQVHGDRCYGTLAASVLDPLGRGESLVVNIDVQGVASLREAAQRYPLLERSLATVFIMVDHDQLKIRIRDRGQDDEAEIARRMKTAEAEIKEASKFDYQINSGTRDEDYQKLLDIIDEARDALGSGE